MRGNDGRRKGIYQTGKVPSHPTRFVAREGLGRVVRVEDLASRWVVPEARNLVAKCCGWHGALETNRRIRTIRILVLEQGSFSGSIVNGR